MAIIPRRPTTTRATMCALAIVALLPASVALAQVAGGGRTIPKTDPTPVPAPSSATGAISGVVSDRATHQPLANAIVYLAIQGQGPVGRVSQRVTDAKGRFVFDELVASNLYFINVTKFGYEDTGFGATPTGPSGSRIVLAEGQWFSAANIEMSKFGAIGGTVLDEFGEPVVGVFVRLLASIRVGGQAQLASGPLARTDDRGVYRIAGLPAGKYFAVLPSVQATVPASATNAEIQGLSPEMWGRLEVALAEGRSYSGPIGALDSGNVRLVLGEYPQPALADGRTRAYPITFFPETTQFSAATPIELAPGEERSAINLRLQPVPSARVSGRVENLGPGSGKLALRMLLPGLENLAEGSEVATTIVEPDGSFTFANIPAGTYAIDARQTRFEFYYAPGPDRGSRSMPLIPGRELLARQTFGRVSAGPWGAGFATFLPAMDNTYFGRVSVIVGTADVSDVTLALHPAITIRGQFQFEDMPVPNVSPQMGIEPTGANWNLGVILSDQREVPSPGFVLHSVAPGQYFLRPGPTPVSAVKSIVVNGEDYSKKPLDLSSVRDVDSVTITVTGKYAIVNGEVHDGQGRPADHAAVLLFPTDRSLWTDFGPTPVWAKRAMASTAGAFDLSPLRAGEYFVVAVDASSVGNWLDAAYLAKAASAATRVTVEWGATRTMNLTLAVVR